MATKSSYGIAGQEITELFGAYLEGSSERPFLALSMTVLEEEPRSAIGKSLEALGFGDAKEGDRPACSFATLAPDGEVALDAQALFLMVEGLDPWRLIVTDDKAAALVETAYRTTLPRDTATRIFGRDGAIFTDLAALIQDETGKRKAWEIFKSLK